MFNRLSVAALATFAVLATAALSSTSASAHFGGGRGGGGGGHFGGGWGHHGGGGGWGHRWGGARFWPPGGGWGWGHQWGGWRRPCWRERPWCNTPTIYGGGNFPAPVTAYSAAPAAPPPPKPDCLSKGYLPDGSVVFTDRCTHEGAVGQREDVSVQGAPPQGGPPYAR